MRIRTVLRVFATVVMVIAFGEAVISMLDLRNALISFIGAIGAILLAGLLWMLTEISEQLAELPQDLAERTAAHISVESAAAPQQPLRPHGQSVVAPRP